MDEALAHWLAERRLSAVGASVGGGVQVDWRRCTPVRPGTPGGAGLSVRAGTLLVAASPIALRPQRNPPRALSAPVCESTAPDAQPVTPRCSSVLARRAGGENIFEHHLLIPGYRAMDRAALKAGAASAFPVSGPGILVVAEASEWRQIASDLPDAQHVTPGAEPLDALRTVGAVRHLVWIAAAREPRSVLDAQEARRSLATCSVGSKRFSRQVMASGRCRGP